MKPLLRALAVLALVASLSGCTNVEPPASATNGSPSPTSSSAPSPTPSVEEDVTFTFECGYLTDDGTAVTIDVEFTSFEDAWEHEPATTWCMSTQHGSAYTPLQREAVEIAGDVLPDGIEQVGVLYEHCAIRDNAYLEQGYLAVNQAQEVRGFLHICPDRPGAENLRAMSGS